MATMVPDRDWSFLPAELLQFLSEKSTFLADYIRFRAVCHPWRSALSPRALHLPVQFPWLMLPYLYVGNDDYDSTRLFYDLSTSKMHRIDLPETRGARICGSSHGWLVLWKDCQLSLLNPITRAMISLPPFSGPPHPLGIPPLNKSNDEFFFEDWDADRYAMNPTSNLHVVKAILTSSPLDPGCMVFVCASGVWRLSFCKIGDEHWTIIEFEYFLPPEYDILDLTYSNGCLYTIYQYAAVTVYNINTLSRVMLNCFVPIGDPGALYLVDGLSQDVLLVASRIAINGAPEWQTDFIVYKLRSDEKPKWIHMTDIGQNVFFLGCDHHAFALSSSNLQLQEWGANCLCYDTFFDHNIKLARIDDGTVNAITGNLCSSQDNWLWQKSLWLTPSLN